MTDMTFQCMDKFMLSLRSARTTQLLAFLKNWLAHFPSGDICTFIRHYYWCFYHVCSQFIWWYRTILLFENDFASTLYEVAVINVLL